jgi:ABC-type enterobactin transport system permease subunit
MGISYYLAAIESTPRLSIYLHGGNIINNKYFYETMNSKLFLMVIAVIAAFGIVAAATVSPITIATPALAQNMTGGDATGANMTAGNSTGGNWTK